MIGTAWEAKMFGGVAEARQVLRDRGFDAQETDLLVGALIPSFGFEPITGEGPIGGTRFGGTPDLPPGTAWPRPPAAEDPEVIAGRGDDEATVRMREHMALGLPYAFLAQVDLVEAAFFDLPASGLPGDGRLLFFYDLAVGPWETGTRTARVIWDPTPRDALVRTSMPSDLDAAAAREFAQIAALHSRYDDASVPAGEQGTTYGGPACAMRLRPSLRFDDRTVDRRVLPGLRAPHGGTNEGFERFWNRYQDLYPGCLPERYGVHRQQLLGSPDPVQGDPLHDAVAVSDFGAQFLDGDAWRNHGQEIKERTVDWRLLLQVDLGDWMNDRYMEGTVYFVIRASDLAERRFEGVVAVYQQT
ncbi:DUF1963 domain-containing protein [Methylobacterium sp. WL6]|uniref:DUF1963 domain-containing protein n=1 Tax=Methylobacterium sp. WL6 TaxID=2603901 RepID=UPI0011C6F22E|nr:DUF1963 domain-containing protein [Methylobacterium sp. WL6]TXN70473.1 DUF1963 domain-containing protein [Methylobacterium sp. WL6]